jgi:hypothetical protein
MQSVVLTAQQPLVGQDLLINDASRSHSVGLLWASDQPDAEISDSNQHSQEAYSYMPPEGFEPTTPACERPQTHS